MAAHKGVATSNPHGANQYKLDPRQSLFLAYYLEPKSQSFGNATKSAILAGFEEDYAKNIWNRMPTWLSKKVDEFKTSRLLEKAESNIDKMLEMDTVEQAMGAFGPLYEKVPIGKKKKGKKQQFKRVPVLKDNIGKMKIKADLSTFVAKTVGKKMYGGDETPGARVLIINISGQSSERYGAHPSTSQNSD